MIEFIIIAQILAISANMYLLFLERKYCKHLEWWSDLGAIIILAFNLIPIVGLLGSIAHCVDCARNIANEFNNVLKEREKDCVLSREYI